MSRQRQRGTEFESAVVAYLSEQLGEDGRIGGIDRTAPHGGGDVGDVYGVFRAGLPVVIECKSYRKNEFLAGWLDEAEAERGNADALAGVVVSKRRGIGTKNMGQQLVSMTLADFVALIAGQRGDWE